MNLVPGRISLERVEQAAATVRQRLLLATSALGAAHVPYAVAGDWCTCYWIASADKGAVRGCVDVEIILRRSEFARAKEALQVAGLHYKGTASKSQFLPDANARDRDGVDVFYAMERVVPEQVEPTPDVIESESGAEFCVLTLDAIVRLSLSRGRTLDQVHVRDLIDVGLVDASWLAMLPKSLISRLQHLLDTPNG